jgi:hypothetical protein
MVIAVIALGVVALLLNPGPLVALGNVVAAGAGPLFAGLIIGAAITLLGSIAFTSFSTTVNAKREGRERASARLSALVDEVERQQFRLLLEETGARFAARGMSNVLQGAVRVDRLAVVLTQTPAGYVGLLTDDEKLVVSPAQPSSREARRVVLEEYAQDEADPQTFWPPSPSEPAVLTGVAS